MSRWNVTRRLLQGDELPMGCCIKYTVGPEWSGAEFETFNEAIAQIELDAPSETALILAYPGEYPEAVVVPSTIPRLTIASLATNFISTSGPVITGSLVWNMAPGGTAGIGVSVTGPVTINDPGNATRAYIRFGAVNIAGNTAINSVATALGATVRAELTLFSGRIDGAANTFRLRGGAWLEGGAFTLHSSGRLSGTDMKGSFTTVNWNLHSNIGSWGVSAGCEVWGRINFSGSSCTFRESYIDYPGPPAITDACTSTSFCQGNSFAHNAGPGTFAYVKTGASLLHEGGNVFLEGQEYPWYDIQAGTVHQGGAEMDVQLRRALRLSGSPVLTRAQVGAQRKTTVVKTDAGGNATLPAIAGVEPGCTVILKDDSGAAAASPISLSAAVGENIDGDASVRVASNFGAVEVQQMTATRWGVISRATAPADVVTGSLALGRNTEMNPGSLVPIWVPTAMVVRSVFSYFWANNTATGVVLGLYDSAGNLLATSAAFNPVNGAINRAAMVTAVFVPQGLYFVGITKAGGGNIRIPYLPITNAAEPQLGGSFAFVAALPASVAIVETANFKAWWLGISERN